MSAPTGLYCSFDTLLSGVIHKTFFFNPRESKPSHKKIGLHGWLHFLVVHYPSPSRGRESIYMRRIVILLLVCCFSRGLVLANKVSSDVALYVGTMFMEHRYGNNFSSLELTLNQPFQYLYIIQNRKGKGFVIVSADDCIDPIVAYSDNSDIGDTIPPSVYLWLSEYDNQLESLLENEERYPIKASSAWMQILSDSNMPPVYDAVSALINTTWNQAPLYNDMCPTGTYTGCTATAMAQIMKYWNHPYVGIGHHSYIHRTYGALSANFRNTYYDWNNMPTSISSSSSSVQRLAVSTLMYHCGVAIDMDYGTTGSGGAALANCNGVNYPCAENAFKNHFDYQESLIGVNRVCYSDSLWNSMLYTELINNRPILYTGEGSGAHAFIIDGMDNNNRYHVNWGWGGAWDGFFLLNVMRPNPSSGQNDFSYNQRAIIGIEPNLSNIRTIPSLVTVDKSGSMDTIWVRSNPNTSNGWIASSNQSWAHITPTNGIGGGVQSMMLIQSDSNPNNVQRIATINVIQGIDTFPVKIIQKDSLHAGSGWYGNDNMSHIIFGLANKDYLVRPEFFGMFQKGVQLKKVRFSTYPDIRSRGNYVDLKIYENNTLPSTRSELRSRCLGNMVYFQRYYFRDHGEHEIILDTPYIVKNENFWISIVPSDTILFPIFLTICQIQSRIHKGIGFLG